MRVPGDANCIAAASIAGRIDFPMDAFGPDVGNKTATDSVESVPYIPALKLPYCNWAGVETLARSYSEYHRLFVPLHPVKMADMQIKRRMFFIICIEISILFCIILLQRI